MALQLPRCAECGASVRSRDDEGCPYCGTAYAWALWEELTDEIAEDRAEVLEADALAFEAAIHRVECSPAFSRKRLGAHLENRRALPPRPQLDPDGTQLDPATLLLGMIGFVVPTMVGLVTAGLPGAALGFLLGFGLLGVLHLREHGGRVRRYRSARNRQLRRGKVLQVASGVLEVGAPEDHGSGPSARRGRAVVLHTAKGDQHVCLASADSTLRAGDLGIARIRGIDLEGFDVHDHVAGRE